MTRVRIARLTALLLCGAVGGACSSDGTGPDFVGVRFYQIESVDNSTMPARLFTLPFGGSVWLDSATLVPYAVGRTVDQRLVNDRTGRGGTGGNTRDTTVARGQMMDLRVMREMNGTQVVRAFRDSTLVDVTVKDTMFIISRPHPDPSRTRVDTGYVLGDKLVVPWRMDFQAQYGVPLRVTELVYRISR